MAIKWGDRRSRSGWRRLPSEGRRSWVVQAPGMKLLLELTFQGVLNGSIYALIAVGLVMVYGLLRVLHIAHAGMFTLGAYIGLEVTNATGSLALAMICSVVTVGSPGSRFIASVTNRY